MQFHARLVHADSGTRVVQVSARSGDLQLGSALGEANTAEAAEERALQRLQQRLASTSPSAAPLPSLASAPPAMAAASAAAPAAPDPAGTVSAGADPDVPAAAPAIPAAAALRGGATATGLARRAAAPSHRFPAAASPPRAPSLQGIPPGPAGPEAAAAGPRRKPAASPAGPEGANDHTAAAAAPQRLPAAEAADGPEPVDAGPPSETALEVAPQEVDPLEMAPLEVDPLEEPPADPEDWSRELTAVDLQLRRLGWDRQKEGLYLQRAFHHPSRSRLTRYGDLLAYLAALEGLSAGSDPALAPVPLRRADLLAQGDELLARLGWSAERGRAFLELHLQRISRRQLSDAQLLHFNMLLESELLAAATGEGPGATAADADHPDPAFTVGNGTQR